MGTRTSRMPAQAKFHAWMQVAYDHLGHFWNRQKDLQEEALRVAKDTHHWVLAAAILLEHHIERLGHSVTCGQSSSQGLSGSCLHSRNGRSMRSHGRCSPVNQQGQTPSVVRHPGEPVKKQAPFPSPTKSRRNVTCLHQLQKTLAYAKALQQWAEEAKP